MKTLPDNLRDLFAYDVLHGYLVWRNHRGKAAKGSVAGFIDKQGYRIVRIQGINYRHSRLVYRWMHGIDPTDTIDHIDRQRSNDCIWNLRDITIAVQMSNRSGFTGVRKPGRCPRWQMRIVIDGVRESHYYDTEAEALAAYQHLSVTRTKV